jgi:hypothetical protein
MWRNNNLKRSQGIARAGVLLLGVGGGKQLHNFHQGHDRCNRTLCKASVHSHEPEPSQFSRALGIS